MKTKNKRKKLEMSLIFEQTVGNLGPNIIFGTHFFSEHDDEDKIQAILNKFKSGQKVVVSITTVEGGNI